MGSSEADRLTNRSRKFRERRHKSKRLMPEAKISVRDILSSTTLWLAVAVLLYLVLHLAGALHPVLELASHGVVHAAGFIILLLPCLLFFKRYIMATAMVPCFLVLLWSIQPWQLSPAPPPTASGKSEIKVLSWNVLASNRQPEDVRALIQEQDPDVVVLLEVSKGFEEVLKKLEEDYPEHLSQLSWNGDGIAVLSRIEGTRLRFEDFSWPRQPAVIAKIPGPDRGDIPLHLIGMHALSPFPTYRAQGRNQQLSAVAEWVENNPGAACLCGDLNITPWTAGFRNLLDAGLKDTRIGVGNEATWPAALGPLGIPIDHVLNNAGCEVVSREVLGSAPGSDHRPILFTVNY